MPGKNLVLKDQQPLFREGDKAEGMFLVRKGELSVYLEKDGREVPLAKVGAGSIIGEMAFFDKQPRSASVKAAENGTEITLITSQDFSKLMKQIPKWFVSIMAALSSRLRQTNERLQKIENAANGDKAPYEDLRRTLHILTLLYSSEAERTEHKKWLLNEETSTKSVNDILKLEASWVHKIFKCLADHGFITQTKDNYGKLAYETQKKTQFRIVSLFVDEFLKKFGGDLFVPETVIQMLVCLKELSSDKAYDNASIELDSLKEYASAKPDVDVSIFDECLSYFTKGIEGVTATGNGEKFSFSKIEVKALTLSIAYYRLIFDFHKENLM